MNDFTYTQTNEKNFNSELIRFSLSLILILLWILSLVLNVFFKQLLDIQQFWISTFSRISDDFS